MERHYIPSRWVNSSVLNLRRICECFLDETWRKDNCVVEVSEHKNVAENPFDKLKMNLSSQNIFGGKKGMKQKVRGTRSTRFTVEESEMEGLNPEFWNTLLKVSKCAFAHDHQTCCLSGA